MPGSSNCAIKPERIKLPSEKSSHLSPSYLFCVFLDMFICDVLRHQLYLRFLFDHRVGMCYKGRTRRYFSLDYIRFPAVNRCFKMESVWPIGTSIAIS